jgi:predicted metal-dependent hydrolase
MNPWPVYPSTVDLPSRRRPRARVTRASHRFPAREDGRVRYGGGEIPFVIVRERARRRPAYGVAPELGVVFLVSPDTPSEPLREVVRENARAFFARLRAARERAEWSAPKRFVDGERAFYLGKRYRLKLVPVADRDRMSSATPYRGRLVVTVTAGASPARSGKHVRLALERLYWLVTGERVLDCIGWISRRLGVPRPELAMRDLDHIWGAHPKKGFVIFNWRIAQLPVRLIELVVAHELAHHGHRGHGPRFYQRLAKAIPDHADRAALLARYGPACFW